MTDVGPSVRRPGAPGRGADLLTDVRVVDTTDARGAACGRFLADLGADVLRVEAPGGGRAHDAHPLVDGVSAGYAVHNAGKRRCTLDRGTETGRAAFEDAIAGCDIWIDGCSPSELARSGLDLERVRREHPQLVILSITDFGHTGPYRDWVATDWVLLALSGMLSRSGVPGRPPLMPPGALAGESTAVQAAWVALLAYWRRLHTGEGDLIDFSLHDATAQILDPAFGAIGTAAAQAVAPIFHRGRPDSLLYPIFACRDGHVRIVILSQRQWQGLWEWLGQPTEFADPALNQARERYRVADRLYPYLAAFFAERSAAQLVEEGQRRGVPIAPVLSPSQVLAAEHFEQRGAFVDVALPSTTGRMPSGHLIVDGRRAGPSEPVPAVPVLRDVAGWRPRPTEAAAASQPGVRPLSGLRVLDLGVIVMGGEAGRLFADQGADVIKVENRHYPDGARMMGMTSRFAGAHRNKRSIGLNLRDPRGLALFEQLVTVSDVLLNNFRPGTLESLGIAPARLLELNPRLVVATSCAMGEHGPWRDWMGYGPLVRSASGLTYLWRDPDRQSGFGDATTVYPDHLVARAVVSGTLAALIRRRRSGTGTHIESAQAESIIAGLAPDYLRESVEPGTIAPRSTGEADAPWGVYPCAGDDEWCVVSVRDADDWAALLKVADLPGLADDPAVSTRNSRVQARSRIDAALAEWTATRSPDTVAAQLQEAGVPAAPMRRVEELLDDPQLQARGFFARMRHPAVDGEIIAERGPSRSANLPDPPLRPAPFYGQHTHEVCRQLLGLSDGDVEELISAGVVDGPTEDERQLVASTDGPVPAGLAADR